MSLRSALEQGGPPTRRAIAEREEWSLGDYLCTAGPQDEPFEERHERVAVALVVSGTFRYRTDAGTALLYPGSFLLGNSGACFECGHEHGVGDRCMGLHVRRDLFAEVAFSAAGTSGFRFRSAMLPALSELTPSSLELQQAAMWDSPLALEETVFSLMETVLAQVGGGMRMPSKVLPSASRRLTRVFDHIEAQLTRSIDLAELAGIAAMSKYHFLRLFKRMCGITPYQYILGRRLRNAALTLRRTNTPIALIALEQGFGDLSTFNRLFRRVMLCTPTDFRKAAQLRSWVPLSLSS
jgi:AraC-like DNA-binding protein